MKKLIIIVGLLLSSIYAQLQDTLTLYECYDLAEKAHPLYKNYAITEEIGKLKTEKISTSQYPSLNLKGQATYQSDVIDLEQVFSALSNPNMAQPEIEALPKDQYKVYLEASQLIYDGGLIKGMKKLEEESVKADLQKLKIEVYGIKEKINQNYFKVLILQEQTKIIELFKNELNERKNVLRTSFENGVVRQSDTLNLSTELLKLDQQLIELEYARKTLISSLSYLVGIDLSVETNLKAPEEFFIFNIANERPEMELFELERSKIDLRSDVIEKTRYPVVAGFGQFGYGRPGLNMLNPEFDDYYLLGVNIKWNIWDWGTVKKDKQSLELTKHMINNQERNFKRNINILDNIESSNIQKLQELIKKDDEIIQLHEQITKRASVELENGTITSVDYLNHLNEEKRAKLNRVVHQIAIAEADARLRILNGQF